MATLQRDVLSDDALKMRQVVILGHSRGGLIGRAFLGHPDFRSGRVGVFPRVRGLITISSPHQGSHMALMDDKIIGFLAKVQKVVPMLPNDVGNEVINKLKKIDDYVGAHGDEIEPDSSFSRPCRPKSRCVLLCAASRWGAPLPGFCAYICGPIPLAAWSPKGRRWQDRVPLEAKAMEAKGASPIPDGLPLKLLGMDLDEIMPGRGDGLTADKRCRFPPSFRAEEHITVPLSHAQELWDATLQAEIIKRLDTFQ